MAKSKKSRRARRQQSEKQKSSVNQSNAAPVAEEASPEVVVAVPEPAPVKSDEPVTSVRRKMDFSKEYAYVYFELRNITVVAVIMFAFMIGLSIFI